MATKKDKETPEQIIAKLREAEQLLREGAKPHEVHRWLGVNEETYFEWNKRFGGMRPDQAKRVAKLEHENAKLRKLLANLRGETQAFAGDASEPRA